MGKINSAPAAVGVDFGTSTTLVGRRDGGIGVPVPIGTEASSWIPSVVGLDGTKLVVGEAALKLPRDKVARSPKRFLTSDQEVLTTPDGSEIKTVDAVRAILRETLSRASQQGVDFSGSARVQFGCPAMWRAPQRELLVEVANECGADIQLGDIIDEPIAAGVAWIQDRSRAGAIPTTKVLVFDPGGGTLDIALLQVRERDGSPEVTVLSADGIDESGDVLDESIAEDLGREYAAELRSVAPALVAESLLLDRSRELKEALSTVQNERLVLGGGHRLALSYSRARLEAAFAGQCVRAMRLVQSVVRAGKLREQQTLKTSEIRSLDWEALAQGIGDILLVGGLSQVPMIERELTKLFPSATIHRVARPQEAIVRGLVFAEEFERLNLHRPAFDFWITYLDRHGREMGQPTQIYPAFTPLYEPHDVRTKDSGLGFQADVPRAPGNAAQAMLHCRSVEGHDIKLDVEGQAQPGILVKVSGQDRVLFKLYANGDITFGPYASLQMRVKSWPTLRGSHHNWKLGLIRYGLKTSSDNGMAISARPTRGR